VLSGMSVTDLINTVASQDTARIVKVPGIGKKTAERLMLELKGKLGDGVSIGFSFTSDNQGDILQALLALGYSDKDAGTAVKAMPNDIGVSDGIKMALKALAK
jgi:Holliday junction DNA helicase RuvA